MSKEITLREYADLQEEILYNKGEYHHSHTMFIDLSDMWRGCTACRTGDSTIKGHEQLQLPCPNYMEARDEKH